MKKRLICFFTVTVMLLCCFSAAVSAVGDVIDFTRDSLSLYLGQSYQLAMNGSVTVSSFSSSDPGIVSVNAEGMVRADSVGTSIITAYDDKGNSATCTVSVLKGTAPQSVELETQSLTMTEGESYALSAKVLPENIDDPRLFYFSSDESVARVDKNGYIKALKNGVAVITVESSSAAVSSKCIVKVNRRSGQNSFSVSISGTLYSSASEKKPNMLVELSTSNQSYEATTDINGKFYIDNIVQGNYTMRVFRNQQSRQAVAAGQVSVGSYDITMLCFIYGKDLVVISQDDQVGSATVTDVTLKNQPTILNVGESHDLSFTVTPKNAALPTMKCKSSNEDVAVVDVDGRITGISEGTANITYATADGKISHTCKVTVVNSNKSDLSWLIIAFEALTFITIIVLFLISYRRFIRGKEREEGLIPAKKARRVRK